MALRIAVVGLGHGTDYLPLAKGNARTQLVAVVDTDAARREAAAAKYGAPAFASLRDLLAAHVADAVALALPTPLHAETSIACLAAGLHVLQEKPLCRTDAEADAIAAAVARSGKVFQVGYEVRSSPLHQAMLRHVAAGDLGRLTNIWYNQHTYHKPGADRWRDDRANMGGKLFDCAVHYLDLMQQWAGAPLVRVAALGHVVGQTGPCANELPDVAIIALEYANGVRGCYNFGQVNRFNDDASFGLAGTTGRVMGNPWLPSGAGSYELRTDGGVRVSHVVFDGKLTSPGHLGWREQFDHFVATVLDGAQNFCPIADAVGIHRQMRAIDRALATGTVVTLAG